MVAPNVLKEADLPDAAPGGDPAGPAGRGSAAYERDYMRWIEDQARALEGRDWAALDLPNLVDEVASLGKSEKRAIESRLGVLMLHLLKWRFQAERRSTSWRAAIIEQRRRLARDMAESPSLASYPAAILAGEHEMARLKAAGETGLSVERIPETCPFTVEQVLDEAFYPDSVDD